VRGEDPNAAVVHVYPDMLDQIYASKQKSPEQLQEEAKQRTIAAPTDGQLRQTALEQLTAEKKEANYSAMTRRGETPDTNPTEDEIQARIAELRNAEPSQEQKSTDYDIAQSRPSAIRGAYGAAGGAITKVGGALSPILGSGNAVSKFGQAAERIPSYANKGQGAQSAVENVGEFLGALGPQLGELATMPGGAVAKFAGLQGLHAAGEGKGLKGVAKDIGVGGSTGAAFELGGAFENPIAKLGSVFGGSAIVNAATGMPIDENFKNSVVNTLFEAQTTFGPRIANKFFRFWKGGEPLTVGVTPKGEVVIPKHQDIPTQNEVVLDPENKVYVTLKPIDTGETKTEPTQPTATLPEISQESAPVDEKPLVQAENPASKTPSEVSKVDEHDPSTFDHDFEVGSQVKFKRTYGPSSQYSEIAQGRVNRIELNAEGEPMYGIEYTDKKGKQRQTYALQSEIKTKPVDKSKIQYESTPSLESPALEANKPVENNDNVPPPEEVESGKKYPSVAERNKMLDEYHKVADPLLREAVELQERYKKAKTPSLKKKIERRADGISQQLNDLGEKYPALRTDEYGIEQASRLERRARGGSDANIQDIITEAKGLPWNGRTAQVYWEIAQNPRYSESIRKQAKADYEKHWDSAPIEEGTAKEAKPPTTQASKEADSTKGDNALSPEKGFDISAQETKPLGVAKLKEMRDSERRKAETDNLTGLANRSALDKALPSAEADPNTSVIAFDANNFGKINKEVGQEAGDKALKDIGDAIKQAATENGVGERVFRRGGDEFVVLAPKDVADKVRARAEELYGDKKYGSTNVSLSGTVGDTFKAADSTLQEAKAKRKSVKDSAAPTTEEVRVDRLKNFRQEANRKKHLAFGQVKALRQQVKDAPMSRKPMLRLELIKAESQYKEHLRDEQSAVRDLKDIKSATIPADEPNKPTRPDTPRNNGSDVTAERGQSGEVKSESNGSFTKNKHFTQSKVEAARERIAKRGTQLKSGIDPTELADYAIIAGAYIESGLRSFADFSKAMIEDIGEAIKPHLKDLYAQVRKENNFEGMDDPTSIKNATTEAERAERNIPPAEKSAKREFGTVWDEAKGKIEGDPTYAKDLIKELQSAPRPLTDTENAVLLHKQMEARTAFDSAAKDLAKAVDKGDELGIISARAKLAPLSDQLKDIYDVGRKMGTENARGLASRRMMVNEDFSLASLELRKRAAVGGRSLTDTERTELQKVADDYKAKAEALEQHVSDRDLQIAAMKAKMPSSKVIQAAEGIVQKLDQRANAARERLKSRGNVFTAGIDPVALKDLAEIGASHIANVGLDFAKFSERMVKEFGEKIKPHLEDIYDASNKWFDRNVGGQKEIVVGRAKTVTEITDDIAEKLKGKDNDISYLVQQLAKKFVSEGVTDREKLINKVHDTLKEIDPEITRRDAMDAISGYGQYHQLSKNEVDVKLRDLKGQMQQIAKLEDMAKGSAPQKTGLERRTPSDEERRLVKEVEEAKRVGGYKVTDPATQLRTSTQAIKTRLENQIKDLEAEITSKQKAVKTKSPTPTTPEIEALKTKRDAVKKLHAEIFPESKTGMTDEQKLKAWKTRTNNRIEELKDKLAKGDFSARPKRTPLPLDAEGLRLRADLERVKQNFNTALRRDQLKNRTASERAMDFIAAWSRASMLSYPTTLAKITAAAVSRIATTPIEEGVGGMIGKAIPKLADKATYEGGFNTRAEAKAVTTGVMQGIKDAVKIMRTGKSDLDAVFGKHYEKDKLESVLEYFGGLEHGALKAAPKRAAFERAMVKGTEKALKNGEDLSDETVTMRIGTEAYKHANRAIFMQDNRLVSAYKMFQRGLEMPGKDGKVKFSSKAASTLLKVIFPIVKIPTNYVAETANYATGVPVGITKAVSAYRKGIENLSPEEADIIMRHLKKGSIGLVGLSLGFFNPQMFGGYYQQGEKRDEKDVDAGGMKIGGVEIPRLLVHNPLFETFQIGATMRRVMDAKVKKTSEETKGPIAGLFAGSLGLAEEVPFVKNTIEMEKLFDPKQREEYLGEFMASRVVPGLSTWAAKQMDKDENGETIKRKPESILEFLEADIPGLRKNVKTKSEAKYGRENSSTVKEYLQHEGKLATTDDLVDVIKEERRKGNDTTDYETALRKKVVRARGTGTFTQEEAERVNKLLGTEFTPKVKQKN
jgi:diguanylate cyclase (GGDEF)-like protein